jgi:sulfate adenylyltransferase (ADP) / ATP adenylyltransferase
MGTLWQKILRTRDYALQTGAQLPIPTDYEFIEDGDVRFFVRIVTSLQRKEEDRKKQQQELISGTKVNPFLPYDEKLFVTDISETHIALLNKYNVVDHHLLIITRHFEAQEALLTLQDFEALWLCMAEYEGFGFYNGGEAAGASQRHKHLQIVPLPLAPEGPQVPINPLLAEAAFENGLGIVPGFAFPHVFARLESDLAGFPIAAAKKTFDIYSAMLGRLGMEMPSPGILKKQTSPYCLLVTRQWMLLVPRSVEFFDSISINSLGFAGAFLVRNQEQMDFLKKHGPMNALKGVAFP